MADDKHNDASQEGNSRPLSAGDETTGIAETAEHAVSTDAGEAGDQQVGRWPSISVANDTQDDAHQDRGWQDQSSTEDLEANRISGTSDDAGSASGEAADHQPLGEQPVPPRSPSRASSALIAAFTGAVAAGLVVGGAWLADWPPSSSAPSSASQVSSAEFGALANRVARVESTASKPAASSLDQAAAARVDNLDKSVASLREELTTLRGELATVRGQSDKLAAALKDGSPVPQHDADAPSDLAAISARLAQTEQQVEQTTQALTAEIAKRGAETTKHDTAPISDGPLRQAVAATLLNVAVRQGQPYGDLLAASKTLICRSGYVEAAGDVRRFRRAERECAVSRTSCDRAKTRAVAGQDLRTSDIVNRLQESAVRLVHIERVDASAHGDPPAPSLRESRRHRPAKRCCCCEKRIEYTFAGRSYRRRALDRQGRRPTMPLLPPSRQFASDAMAALTKPAP